MAATAASTTAAPQRRRRTHARNDSIGGGWTPASADAAAKPGSRRSSENCDRTSSSASLRSAAAVASAAPPSILKRNAAAAGSPYGSRTSLLQVAISPYGSTTDLTRDEPTPMATPIASRSRASSPSASDMDFRRLSVTFAGDRRGPVSPPRARSSSSPTVCLQAALGSIASASGNPAAPISPGRRSLGQLSPPGGLAAPVPRRSPLASPEPRRRVSAAPTRTAGSPQPPVEDVAEREIGEQEQELLETMLEAPGTRRESLRPRTSAMVRQWGGSVPDLRRAVATTGSSSGSGLDLRRRLTSPRVSGGSSDNDSGWEEAGSRPLSPIAALSSSSPFSSSSSSSSSALNLRRSSSTSSSTATALPALARGSTASLRLDEGLGASVGELSSADEHSGSLVDPAAAVLAKCASLPCVAAASRQRYSASLLLNGGGGSRSGGNFSRASSTSLSCGSGFGGISLEGGFD